MAQWSPEQRERLVNRISDIDPTFGEKLNSELQNGVQNHLNNGHPESDGIESEP